MSEVIKKIFDEILNGELETVEDLVKQGVSNGLPAAEILNVAMIPAMDEVGRRFEEGDLFVPEMLMSARTMQAGLTILSPYLKDADVKATGKVIAGTVYGDMHDIGKNLLLIMLEGAGFEIEDLGTGVTADQFVEAARTSPGAILGMSALLTTTMPYMKTTIDALQAAGLREQVKVIVGGAPINEEYAQKIGADGYAPDASRAVRLAKTLVGA